MTCRWRGRGAATTVVRLLGAPVAIAALVAGCGGESDSARATDDVRSQGLVDVREVTYRTFDGSRVTGLAAIPRGVPPRGCVIWEFGFRSTKEDASWVWQGFAALGLTTFSIDLRRHGSRARGPDDYQEVLEKPTVFAEVVKGSARDLRSAIDHLEDQPYCDGRIAYGGVSLGGAIGAMVAAADKRVKAAVLVVTPGAWREVLTAPDSPFLPGIEQDSARLDAALKVLSPLDPARFVGRIAPRPVLILSGLDDRTVEIANARTLQAAARDPKAIVEFRGGHNPAAGPDAEKNADAIGSFLLHHVVEPAYGIKGRPDGTFLVQQ